MTTIDHSGPDADGLAARARANATLYRIMEAAPTGTPDAERLALATTAYGQSVAMSANRLARQRLLTAYSRPQDGPFGDIQAVDLLGA